jgi:hypothetical protein
MPRHEADARQHDQHEHSNHGADIFGNVIDTEVLLQETNAAYGNPFVAWLQWRRSREIPAVRDNRNEWHTILKCNGGLTDREQQVLYVALVFYDDDSLVMNAEKDFPAMRMYPEIRETLRGLGILTRGGQPWSNQQVKDVLMRTWRKMMLSRGRQLNGRTRTDKEMLTGINDFLKRMFKRRGGFKRQCKPDCRCINCRKNAA